MFLDCFDVLIDFTVTLIPSISFIWEILLMSLISSKISGALEVL